MIKPFWVKRDWFVTKIHFAIYKPKWLLQLQCHSIKSSPTSTISILKKIVSRLGMSGQCLSPIWTQRLVQNGPKWVIIWNIVDQIQFSCFWEKWVKMANMWKLNLKRMGFLYKKWSFCQEILNFDWFRPFLANFWFQIGIKQLDTLARRNVFCSEALRQVHQTHNCGSRIGFYAVALI